MTDSLSTSKPMDVQARRAAIRGALEGAIAERGLTRFAIIETVGEGRFYPNGMEERSGDVLNEDGRVWFFWTAWDPEREQVTLRVWEPEDPVPALTTSKVYQRARRELGLDGNGTA